MIIEINAWGPREGDPRVPQIKWEYVWVAWSPPVAAPFARSEWIDMEGPGSTWCLQRIEMKLAGRYGWFPWWPKGRRP